MAKRGGGLFTYVADPITGATKYTSFTILLLFLAIVGGILAIVLPFVLSKKDRGDSSEPDKHTVGPDISGLPSRLTIAEVAQGPSAGQAIIYFSPAQATGVACEGCTATFDITITYIGGQPTTPPTFKKVSSPTTSGVVTFDYAASSSGFSPLTPGGNTTVHPTQITVDISARSVNTQTGKSSGPTTFSKTLPYVA